MMTNPRHWAIPCVLLLLLLGGCKKGAAPAAGQLEKLSVRYPIPVLRASMAPFVVATAKGWYAEENLDVSFGFESQAMTPVSSVALGHDQIGVLGGLDTLLVARSNGDPLKAVAILHRNSNFPCLITLKSSGITTVKQLEGKEVGMFYGHITRDVLRSLFRSQGVTVKEKNLGSSNTYDQLISGNVAAQWAFTTAAAVELPESGTEVNVINPADYGIVTQGYTIFATDRFIAEHPDTVRRFLNATFRGVEYSVAHPQETTKMLVEADPKKQLVEWQTRKRLDQINEVISYKAPYYPGYMDSEMIHGTYQRLLDLGVIAKPFPETDAYTTEFLHPPAKQ